VHLILLGIDTILDLKNKEMVSLKMNNQTKIHWGLTGLFAFAMMGSAFMNLSQNPQILEAFKHLQIPAHLTYLLGTLKAFGVVALFLSKWAKIREWAYAGFSFNLLGALYLHLMTGDPMAQNMPILVLFAILMGSYWTQEKKD
jgi:hypothetical protein